MSPDYDVIVIGAGFAGATAARECASRGLRTLVLEARDRLGGRTWTTRLASGEVVEIGGTYVHWMQPHVWSEITRYDLAGDLVAGAVEPEWALVPSGSGLAWCTSAALAAREKALLERFFEPSRTVLPRPHDPLFARAAAEEFDQLTIRDRLDQLDLSADDDAYLTGLFGMEASAPASSASFLSLMRWWALAGHDYGAMEEAVFAYKLGNGVETLLAAILGDGGSEVRRRAPVRRVESRGDEVRVTTVDGVTASAAAVVVATPVGIWPRIDFSPALSEERVEAARDGMQAPWCSKIIAVLRGEGRRVYVQPRAGHPVGFMWTSHLRSPDEQVAAIFGTPHMKDPEDPEELAAAVRDLLPGVEVVESVAGAYLEGDEFAAGGWSYAKPGQLTRFAPHVSFSRPEGRLVFATSDIASGWSGFIDGAVESGLRAGRQVREMLEAEQRTLGWTRDAGPAAEPTLR
jgi:nicotine oxidoreductase